MALEIQILAGDMSVHFICPLQNLYFVGIGIDIRSSKEHMTLTIGKCKNGKSS
jgi:hypothetical protein